MKIDRREFLAGGAVAALAAKRGAVPRAVAADEIRKVLVGRGVKLDG